MHSYPEAAVTYADFRSWIWSCGITSDSRGLVCEPKASSESEMEIQARWFGGEFGRSFTGTDGEKIEIVQFGHWNRAAGPDFTECAVRIDGELKSGPIELDLDVRDWESHGHGNNPAFESTVLHVFTDGPSLNRFYTRSLAHRKIVQVQLPQYAWSQGPPDFLPEAFPGRCVAPLASMNDDEVASLLLSASQYRLHQKTVRLEVMSDSTHPEQALFQGLAEALGFRSNKTAMAVLAQRCPIRELRKMDSIEREARLFGAAGFLDREIFETKAQQESRRYLRELWDRWWKIRGTVEPSGKRAIPWSFSGNRPLNHPQRRVGALAALVEQWPSLRPLWESPVNNLEKHVNNFVKNLAHPFWIHHYTLQARPSDRPLRLIGQDRLRDMLGNVVFPGAIGRNESIWDEFLTLRKVDSNQKLRRASLRLFGPDRERQKLFTSYYHQQQGLLQIYQDFCLEDLSECSHCPFPEQLRQWQHNASRSKSAG
ncbi:MAG: DUF2851 family protein [Verrucomicrobiales bacterium]|nr:DUF2851 family protein [Verrucomicrobiales bacterium]